MREKILESLREKSEYVSGDSISQRLGITRQALWKHIQELKELGYEIAAVPHLGYRLAAVPDRLFSFEISQGLNTKFMARKIHYFDALASTMDAAMQLGLGGLPEGTLIVAESQTKGRGRLGRSWFSPKYKGVYLSFILRPKVLPTQAPILTLLSSTSICEAIEEVVGIQCQIKWPNDILAGNKKLGGILTELHAEMDKVNFVVIGMGLNVNNDKKALVPGAVSLKEIKKEQVNRVTLLQEILRKIEKNYLLWQAKGTLVILDKWRQYALTLGKRVKVDCHKEHVEGEAIDIDADGSLLVRQDSGLISRITAGDVLHCR